jgi:hypothetical protein
MTSEEDVFNAVMQWISCDVQQRKQYLPKVKILFLKINKNLFCF